MYRAMGIEDCVVGSAGEYADLAVRLGTDRSFAEEVRRRIVDRNDILFENANVIREFERFFLEASERAWRDRTTV
jgi:predicted O-linked N-acetylglucosamine transferase (SPINDLY family)